MQDKYRFLSDYIDKRQKMQHLRVLRDFSNTDGVQIFSEGQTFINFCSNNYIGLASHPKLIQTSIEYTRRFGAGAGASRLVCGNFSYHTSLEKKFAAMAGREASLLFPSGFQANLTIIPALADRQSLILADKSCHHSLIQGALLSGAKFLRYRHNELDHLQKLLELHANHPRKLIISESVFSMEGDVADIVQLGEIASRNNALLLIDETHALGVLGANGMGVAYGNDKVDVVVSGFGKAGGTSGAFAACSNLVGKYLLQACGGIIYSTAVPPSVAGAVDAALYLIPEMDLQRQIIERNAIRTREELKLLGFDTGTSCCHIIPVIVGSTAKALSLQKWLESQGLLAVAIRPPTVIDKQSLVRLSISALHTEEHLAKLIEAFGKWRIN